MLANHSPVRHVCRLIIAALAVCALQQVTADNQVGDECQRRGKESIPKDLDFCCFRYLNCRCIKALCQESEYHKLSNCEGNNLYESDCNTTYINNCQSVDDSSFASKCKNTDPDLIAHPTHGHDDLKSSKPSGGATQSAKDASSGTSGSTLIIVIVLVVILVLALLLLQFGTFIAGKKSEKGGKAPRAKKSSSRKNVSGKQAGAPGGSYHSNKHSRQTSVKAQSIRASTARSVGNSSAKYGMLTKGASGTSQNSRKRSSTTQGSFDSRAVNTRYIKEDPNKVSKGSNHEVSKLKKMLI